MIMEFFSKTNYSTNKIQGPRLNYHDWCTNSCLGKHKMHTNIDFTALSPVQTSPHKEKQIFTEFFFNSSVLLPSWSASETQNNMRGAKMTAWKWQCCLATQTRSVWQRSSGAEDETASAFHLERLRYRKWWKCNPRNNLLRSSNPPSSLELAAGENHKMQTCKCPTATSNHILAHQFHITAVDSYPSKKIHDLHSQEICSTLEK